VKLNLEILEKIEKEQGDSFYILDAKQFSKNFVKLLDEFRVYYPSTNIAYSYKTNYIPRLCKIVNEQSGYAEVVSGMEMTLAEKIGVPSKNIYFNGPVKEDEYIKRLLINDGKVNVDSLEELLRIEKIAKENKQIFKLGLRCNFNVDDGVISRFGFDVSKEEFKKSISIIENSEYLELIGLHTHIATRSLDSWKNRTKKIIEVLEEFFSDKLEGFKYISLGGGMSGDMPQELREQFSSYIPTFKEYAEVSSKVFAEYIHNKKLKHNPELLIEPGTALAANSMLYATKIVSIKQIQDRTVATLSGSSYNIMPGGKNLPITVYKNSKIEHKHFENIYFAGYTCIESDYLYNGYNGEITVGDFILFSEVGSYSIVMKPPFIKPNVSMVELLEDESTYKLIKSKEDFDDIFHTYVF